MNSKTASLLSLYKAPSQYSIIVHLIGTGKPLTIKEISSDLKLTYKAAERAMAKLLEKELVQRVPFKEGAYTCDSKQVVLCLLLACTETNKKLEDLTKNSEKS